MKSYVAYDLFQGSGYVLNKYLTRVLGFETMGFIATLLEGAKLFELKEQIENGWFYQTINTVYELSGITRKRQDSIIRKLVFLGILEQENRGMPSKRYFKLDVDELGKLRDLNLNWHDLKEDINEKYKKFSSLSQKDKLIVSEGQTYCSKRATIESLSYKVFNNKYNKGFNKLNQCHIKNDTSDSNLNIISPNENINLNSINKSIKNFIATDGVVPTPKKELTPPAPPKKNMSDNDFKRLKPLIEKWSEETLTGDSTGVKHKLNYSPEGAQSKTILKINKYYQKALESKESYWESIESSLDPKWCKVHSITKESFYTSPIGLKQALKIHHDLLIAQVKKEKFKKLSRSLLDFFYQEQKNDEDKSVVTSWYLYWVCKGNQKEKVIQKIERKYEGHFNIYKVIDHVFEVKRKGKNESNILLQNDSVILADMVIEFIIVKKSQENMKPLRLKNSLIPEYLEEYLLSCKFMGDNFKPQSFFIHRKSWNNFIDFMKDKADESLKKNYELLKFDV